MSYIVWRQYEGRTATKDGTLIVTSRAVEARVTLVGSFIYDSPRVIMAPFEGTITQIMSRPGQTMHQGQPLMRIDTAMLNERRAEARIAQARADQTLTELGNWPSGPEVSRARRAVTTTKLGLSDATSRRAETQVLFDRGIVARTELDEANQRLASARNELANAEGDLRSAQSRANPRALEAARLDAGLARSRVAQLEAQAAQATILAPAPGLLLAAPTDQRASSVDSRDLRVGTQVRAGQSLFLISSIDALSVTAKLNEADLAKVHEGTAVTVHAEQSNIQPLRGMVQTIAPEVTALSGEPRGFDLTVTLVPKQKQLYTIRSGMSATVDILTYDNKNAIILPPNYIKTSSDGPYVILIEPKTTARKRVRVTLSEPLAEGVVVKSGIKAGDVIIK